MRSETMHLSRVRLSQYGWRSMPKTKATEMNWFWSARRQYDGKSFGNPALYATPQTVASLVRETGQNSLDAASGNSVAVRYRLVDLPAGSHRRQMFESRLLLTTGLRPHLEAVAKAKKTQSAVRIRNALRELDEPKGLLRLLVVEDYGTKGLIGDEFDSEGNFCALIRDVENSHKAESTAGGSFGLGAKTLWSCSGLLTVLFSSDVVDHDSEGLRTIGKADLGYHMTAGGDEYGYIGPGFFGIPHGEGGAVSEWLPKGSSALSDLCLTRVTPKNVTASGVSALIVAFDDPESDEDDSQDILDKLRSSIARNFWPAICRGSLNVFVRHEVGDKEELAEDEFVDPTKFVPSFVDGYRRHLSGDVSDKLRHPGDVVSVPVAHTIPATRDEGGVADEHGEMAAEARLIIRLADDGTDDRDLIDCVALARGRAMVTQYLRRRGVALNARAFHAFLIAGTLAADDAAQVVAEVFLRHAEPPSHDEWKLWSGLKARYAHGAGRRLDELFREMSSILAKYVAVKPEASDDGPDALKRLLAIPAVKTAKKSSWSVREGAAHVESGEVVFRVTFEIDRPEGVRLIPKIDLAAESGGVAMDIIELVVNGVPQAESFIVLGKKNGTIAVEGRARSDLVGLQLERCAIRFGAHLIPREVNSANL